MKELFVDMAEQYDITIDALEVSPDHVHILWSFPPCYSIAQVVTRFQSLSARALFEEFPRIKRALRATIGAPLADGAQARVAQYVSAARTGLGNAACTAAWAAGQTTAMLLARGGV